MIIKIIATKGILFYILIFNWMNDLLFNVLLLLDFLPNIIYKLIL